MARAKVRVLLVEDSLYDAAIVRRMLRKDEHADFEVHCVHSAGECLEKLKEKAFDLLLLDYNLPGEDGLALLRCLSGRANMPPMIMLSGWGDEKVAEEAMRCGAYGYCSKSSIISGVLTARIHEALGAPREGKEERPRDELEQRSELAGGTGGKEEKPPTNGPQRRSEAPTETDGISDVIDERMISTGNANLDFRLGGGIPVGSLTLIDGESGAGKSVFTQQLTWGALKYGRGVVVYSNENTKQSLLSQMDSLGMDVTDYHARGKLQVLETPASRLDEQTSPNLDMLLRDIHRLRDCDLVVVDSLTGFLAHRADEEIIPFLTGCKQFYSQGKTVVATVHANVLSDSALGRVISVCDVYLRLRIEIMGDQLVKRLEVAKVRGASKVTGRIITFDVEPGVGIVPAVVVTRCRA
jgi:flagellar protein FlaH